MWMYDQVWLVCPVCKTEFAADLIRLQQQPQRACPNCAQLFDLKGLGFLVQALEQLNQAATLVTFRLKGEQRMTETARMVRMVIAMSGRHPS
jgi:hypothetical protein